jgi:hypothetical protein
MTFTVSLFLFYLSQAAFDDICRDWISQLPFCMFSLRFFDAFQSKSLVRIRMNFSISRRKIFVMIFICWIWLFYVSHDAFDDICHDWISQLPFGMFSLRFFDAFHSKSLVRIKMNFTISSRKIFVMIFICWILLFYLSHDAFDDICHDWISQLPFCMFSHRFFYAFHSKSLVRISMNFCISSRIIFLMIFIC